MRNLVKHFGIFLIAFLIIAGLLSAVSSPWEEPETVPFNTLVSRVQAGEVKSVVISDDSLNVAFTDGSEKISHKERGDSLASLFGAYGVTEQQLSAVDISNKKESAAVTWFAALAPFVIPLVLIIFFIWFMMRQVQGANSKAMMFGQSTAREDDPNKKDPSKRTTFVDVAGNTEAKEELEEIIEFLKQPQKFLKLGARIPKGVLLVGPPGTGKTLLARAVAGEAHAPFFNISGSEFVEMFVGVGASRVRDLFRRAKKSAPSIVFIDELDAVGRQRGAGLGGSHDEREQTLNQILVEMDGFANETNVIVMAATNRPDVLDPALLRPGRFDRRVVIDLPDIKDREAILNLHAKNKPAAEDVNIRKIAERTPGFSGADLFNLLNEAAILTARRDKKTIGQNEIFESIEKVILGPERKTLVMSEREKKITAYHEAGHAIVAHVLPEADPVHKVSVISRGRAGGYTLKLPTEDKRFHSKSEFVADLAVLLAGHAMEKIIFSDVTTGASSDLQKVTSLARRIITEFGMSEKLGPRTFGDHGETVFLGRDLVAHRDYSEKIAQSIDEEIEMFITEAYKTATKVINENMDRVEKIVAVLLEKETIEAEEFKKLMA